MLMRGWKKNTYLTRLIWIFCLSTLNLFLLFHFIKTLHKLFASGPTDFGGVAPILGLLLGVGPIFRGVHFLVEKQHILDLELLGLPAKVLLWINFIAALCILGLSLYILPWSSEYNFNEGYKFAEQGEFEKAIFHLNRSIYQNPDNQDVLLTLATIYEDIKDDEKAKFYYYLAIRNKASRYITLNNLSRLHLKKKENDEAIELLLRAEIDLLKTDHRDEMSKKIGIIYKNLAWAYWAAEDMSLAKKTILKAVSELEDANAVEDYPEVYCLLALLLEDQPTNDLLIECEKGLEKQEPSSLNINLLREAKKKNE